MGQMTTLLANTMAKRIIAGSPWVLTKDLLDHDLSVALKGRYGFRLAVKFTVKTYRPRKGKVATNVLYIYEYDDRENEIRKLTPTVEEREILQNAINVFLLTSYTKSLNDDKADQAHAALAGIETLLRNRT